jgi:hypothetical protein
MRPEMLERLRATMRGEKSLKAVGTVGTLEPAPAPVKVPTAFQQRVPTKKSGVPTVPTVPTQVCRVQNIAPEMAVGLLEPALEPCWNGVGTTPTRRPLYDPMALQAEADRRNRGASEARLTDRWCACGTVATLAVGRFRKSPGNREGVAMWLCQECFEADRGARL